MKESIYRKRLVDSIEIWLDGWMESSEEFESKQSHVLEYVCGCIALFGVPLALAKGLVELLLDPTDSGYKTRTNLG